MNEEQEGETFVRGLPVALLLVAPLWVGAWWLLSRPLAWWLLS